MAIYVTSDLEQEQVLSNKLSNEIAALRHLASTCLADDLVQASIAGQINALEWVCIITV